MLVHDIDCPGMPAYGIKTKETQGGKRKYVHTPICPYNVGIECSDKNCKGCGWFPKKGR